MRAKHVARWSLGAGAVCQSWYLQHEIPPQRVFFVVVGALESHMCGVNEEVGGPTVPTKTMMLMMLALGGCKDLKMHDGSK